MNNIPDKIRIMVVEDEKLLQDAYQFMLKYAGYDVKVASNGLEALHLVKSFKPEIILLDVLMPKLDGIGFLQQARVKDSLPDTLVIACTNLTDQPTADKMMAYGADHQILKSNISPRQLVDLIQQLLRHE